MRRYLDVSGLVFVLGLMVLGATSAAAQAIGAEDATKIRAVIEKQLNALQRDDWAEAYSYAAPAIQRKFGSPDVFRRMILRGYAIVHRPRSVSFEALREDQGRVAQMVHMVGPDGIAGRVVYFMAKQDDGSWRIAGVSLLRAADRSV